MKKTRLSYLYNLGGAAALALVLCVAQPSSGLSASDDGVFVEEDVNDPIEPINRTIFFVNEALETWFIRPAAIFYQIFFPPPIREGIDNIIDNLGEPVTLVNEVLQGEGDRAAVTAERFFINTTYGVLGIFDRATEMGVEEKHKEDLGQTMAVWGVEEGFYLVLPIFGPSNPRDAIGKFVSSYVDPVSYLTSDEVGYARMAFDGVEAYGSVADELDQVKKTSIDYYAAIRSMYRQKRASEIRNGETTDLPPIPDLGMEDDIEEEDAIQEAAGRATP